MMLVICVKCGKEKQKPNGKCPSCGFRPRSAQDLAQALYLSHDVFTQEQREGHPEWIPEEMSVERLKSIAAEIQAGQPHVFDSNRLGKLLAQHAAISKVAPIHVYGALLRFFAPALLFMGALFLAGRVLRSLQ